MSQFFISVNIWENGSEFCLECFSLVSLFIGISTFMGYLISKTSLLKNSSDAV